MPASEQARVAVVLLLLTCTPACRAWAPFEGVHIVQPVSGAPRGTTPDGRISPSSNVLVPHGNGHHGHAARCGQWPVASGTWGPANSYPPFYGNRQRAPCSTSCRWPVASGTWRPASSCQLRVVKIDQAHNHAWLQHHDTHTPIIALRLDGRAVVQRHLCSLQRRRRWHHRRHGCASARGGCVWRPCRRRHGASASWQGVFVRVRAARLQGFGRWTPPARTTHLAMHACRLGSLHVDVCRGGQ
jgi:hypothetical protein